MVDQVLDTMDWSGKKGLPSRLGSTHELLGCDGQTYELNLIRHTGHVDFHYEVSRALAACEGAICGGCHPGDRSQTWPTCTCFGIEPGNHPGDQQD